MTDLRASLGAPDPSELVDAPKAPTVVVQRDAIREAEDAAIAAIRHDLHGLIAGKDLTTRIPLDHLAQLLAAGAFKAMVVPAEYVRGYRDCAAKVRQALGPVVSVTADPFKATDGTEEGS